MKQITRVSVTTSSALLALRVDCHLGKLVGSNGPLSTFAIRMLWQSPTCEQLSSGNQQHLTRPFYPASLRLRPFYWIPLLAFDCCPLGLLRLGHLARIRTFSRFRPSMERRPPMRIARILNTLLQRRTNEPVVVRLGVLETGLLLAIFAKDVRRVLVRLHIANLSRGVQAQSSL